MTPRILLVRHGNTTYDKRVDALLDPPLTKEGVDRIDRTAEFLRNEDLNICRTCSSPLQRALLAAMILDQGRLTVHNGLLPWNLGDIMGKTSEEAEPQIQHLLTYPDLRAPHGESYREFYSRWTEFLNRVMLYAELNPDEVLLLVTHSRNINALQEYVGGKPLGDVQEVTPEGSITLLAKTGLGDWSYNLLWEGN